jgi:hypothetical protein
MSAADVFGQISQIASITSAGSSVASKVFNNTSSSALNSIGAMLGGASSLSSIAQTASAAAGGIGNLASGLNNFAAMGNTSDPLSKARLAIAGIGNLQNAASVAASFVDSINGVGGKGGKAKGANIGNGGGSGGPNGGPTGGGDWKVTLRVPALGGQVEFPVTPQITITDAAKYASAGLVHINYSMQFYESSETSSIQVNGEFPIQNEKEGMILLAAIHLLRASTKMFWGFGAPPPLVFLNGYGDGYMKDVPCVITNFTHTMPEDKDYIPCNGGRVPTLSTIQVQLQPVYSRNMLESLDISQIASGRSLQYL